jgi:hypothetical protein
MDDFYEVTIEDVFSPLVLYEMDSISKNQKKINDLLDSSWNKYKYDIILQVYFIRSKLNHKENAYRIYTWIANNDSQSFNKMLPSIVYYGEWQDLFDLFVSGNLNSVSQSLILTYICKQIQMDYDSPTTVSSLISYLPRERSVKDRVVGWVSLLTEQLQISRKMYRTFLTKIKTKQQQPHSIFRFIQLQ